LAYLVLILWTIKIAAEARDRFGATVCVGVAAMLFWHVVINIGMVSGIFPVVGVTLPLISYGGSSILTVMVALGLVMNVSVRRFAY
jgi:rod shape determining protein RodA